MAKSSRTERLGGSSPAHPRMESPLPCPGRAGVHYAAHVVSSSCNNVVQKSENIGLGTRTESFVHYHMRGYYFHIYHLYHDESLVFATIGQLENYSG